MAVFCAAVAAARKGASTCQVIMDTERRIKAVIARVSAAETEFGEPHAPLAPTADTMGNSIAGIGGLKSGFTGIRFMIMRPSVMN